MTSLGVVGLNNAALTDINGTFVYHEFFGLLSPRRVSNQCRSPLHDLAPVP